MRPIRDGWYIHRGLFLLVLGGMAWLAANATASEDFLAARTAHQIENDWLLQFRVRRLPPQVTDTHSAAVTTAEDAAGAVDGVRDGTYGFHTSNEQTPWWQVDLGQPMPLQRILVYNRCDGNVQDRAARLQVSTSRDGVEWSTLYQHSGPAFLGQSDGKPLVIAAEAATARFVRLQIPGPQYFHLDEVEVYCAGSPDNLARGKPADQSSTSQWSRRTIAFATEESVEATKVTPTSSEIAEVVRRGLALAEDLRRLGVNVAAGEAELRRIGQVPEASDPDQPGDARRERFLQAGWAIRRMALANPLLDFEDLLFVKRTPGSFTHMSDQYYGWWSRPGGGLYVLENFKSDTPRLRCLTDSFPPGSFLRPDLSYDGRRVLFAYCRHYPVLKNEPNKLDKTNVPEDAFYHLYEMNLDGSDARRLTQGKYDDFDGRYLPDGGIVFLSTRRGQHLQCDAGSARASHDGELPDCYVRCGGGPERPVAVYTLHAMAADGGDLRQISPFEMFEWTPSIDGDGRILYARWDYVDRHNMPYMSLWSTLADGTAPQAVFGNYTINPHCVFEARRIPRSRKIIFTASGHHALTGGSLVLLDPRRAADGDAAMTRLTPEVVFPESEGWPSTYFAGPYPLSENHHLVSWSAAPLPPGTPRPQWGMPGPPNDLGIYLFDAFGNLNLVYRDATIGSETPLPIRPRHPEPQVRTLAGEPERGEGRMLIQDVYQGLPDEVAGTVQQLRIVGIPVKTHPTMNYPSLGLTRDDPGKFVLGTAPVEPDGSAHFRVPAGVPFFLQVLDDEGKAVQTMRSATYVQAGQTFTCIGCHEPRNSAPPTRASSAFAREPSTLSPGPSGSWPLSFQQLVGPVLARHCVECHRPEGEAPAFDLRAEKAYEALVDYGQPSLRQHVMARYNQGRSTVNAGAAQQSPLVALLRNGHYDVHLQRDDWIRLFTWMDTYGQRLGSFGPEQEEQLRKLRQRLTSSVISRTSSNQ